MLSEWWGKVRRREGRLTIPTRFGEATVYTMPDEDGSLVRMLNVGGEGLSVGELSVRTGEISISGSIEYVQYTKPREKTVGGFFKRLAR